MFGRDPGVDLRRIAREAETVAGATVDPERPRGQHLSPEIGHEPMGQGIRWPFWALAAFIVAAAIFIAWAAQGGRL